MDAARLARISQRQSGLFTRRQARGCGFSAEVIRRRLRTGEWVQVLGAVLAVGGTRLSAPLYDLAAVLAVPGSVLAGPSAARSHGMPVPDTPPHLAVTWPRNPRLSGVHFFRDPLAPDDLVRRNDMLVTSRQRTVFDCLRVLPDPEAVGLLDRALQQRWITVNELAWRVRAFAGRHGAPRLARFARLAGSGAQSAAERLATDLLGTAGIGGWRANVKVLDRYERFIGIGDIVFARERLVIEVDGRAHHVTPDRFERDRQRQNEMVAAGWTVLRFTWRDLTTRQAAVVATVRAMLTKLRR